MKVLLEMVLILTAYPYPPFYLFCLMRPHLLARIVRKQAKACLILPKKIRAGCLIVQILAIQAVCRLSGAQRVMQNQRGKR
ncbi:hypothetical protein V8J88_13625 [Massilia sp. W12]|uniref:hypothetical protein n=1 Tax=Massilia sp. W12 TaxID=3126507 RepID=UPI0030D1A63B